LGHSVVGNYGVGNYS